MGKFPIAINLKKIKAIKLRGSNQVVLVFKNGERSAQHVGLTTKAKLAALVDA